MGWSASWDAYKTAVHDNPGLGNVDKVAYLMSLLEGTAKEAIAGPALTYKASSINTDLKSSFTPPSSSSNEFDYGISSTNTEGKREVLRSGYLSGTRKEECCAICPVFTHVLIYACALSYPATCYCKNVLSSEGWQRVQFL